MLTPDDLLNITGGAESVAEQLNRYITNAIVSRIVARLERKDDYIITSLDKWQFEVAQESGILLEDITRGIAEAANLQETELKKAMQEAGVKAVTIDGEKTPQMSRRMRKLMEYNQKATMGEWHNFTGTHANSSQQAFIRECDKAYHLVTSGTVSCAQAVAEAVENIAKDGTKVEYPSGHKDSIETATLRAVRTSISKMSMEMVIDNMKETGADIVLVSAHLGARDKGTGPMNHASWQGQFYSLSGNDKRFKPFYETTGYGTGEGLGGYNCRHSIGIGDGVNNPYKNINTKENREAYQLSQRQRLLERRIRNTRRAVEALETAKDTAKNPDVKTRLTTDYEKKKQLLKKQNEDYRDFCKQSDLKPKYDRLQTAKTVKNEKTVNSEDIIEKQKTVEKFDKSDNILSQEEVIEKAKELGDAIVKGQAELTFDNGNCIFDYVSRELKYDALPQVVDSAMFEQLAKNSSVGTMYRGIEADTKEQALQYAECFKSGKMYAGANYNYGSGTYFSPDKNKAEEYNNQDVMLRATLSKNAKIVDYSEIVKEYSLTGADIAKQRKGDATEAWEDILATSSEYAAIKGYDAIRMNGALGQNHIIVLNRGVVIVHR